MTGSLPSYMKLNIMMRMTTSIHHTHDEDDTLAIYYSTGDAVGVGVKTGGSRVGGLKLCV